MPCKATGKFDGLNCKETNTHTNTHTSTHTHTQTQTHIHTYFVVAAAVFCRCGEARQRRPP